MAFFHRSCLFFMVSSLGLAGCSHSSSDLLPSLSTDSAGFLMSGSGSPPALGTTFFEPQGVTPGVNTQTFVGNRIATYRNELTALQGAISTQNSQLQEVRNKTIRDSNDYHENVATMRAKLQLGTTPSNPLLLNRWEVAQSQLNTVNQDVVIMNQLAQGIRVNQSSIGSLLSSVSSSFTIPGAVDEDHRQLRILEDETRQTAVLIERLLAELNSDISRQTAYVTNEKANLGMLGGAIQNGQLFGTVGPDGYSQGGGFVGSSLGGGTGAAMGANPAMMGTPLVVVRFDRANVAFEAPLSRAVQTALSRNPGASFTVVSVSGGSAGMASDGAQRVMRVITSQGVPISRVSLSATTQPGVNEVRVYAR